MQTIEVATTDLDPFSDEALRDPYGLYRQLRDLGPVVRLERWDLLALMRYEEVRAALFDWETYSSLAVGLNPAFNDFAAPDVDTNVLMASPPQHTKLRAILGDDLAPRNLRQRLQPIVEERAETLVDELVARGSFDAVLDLARPFVLGLICDFNGLPPHGRERFLGWADDLFNGFGPFNERCQRGLEQGQAMFQYLHQECGPGQVTPGSWAATIYAAAERGEIPMAIAPNLLVTYVVPALDTTINAIGFALKLFAEHPDQWDLVRREPELVAGAFREVLRLESPVQCFGRRLMRDVEIAGVPVPAGSHMMIAYGSANRDERRWEAPERFDVRRDNVRHLSFGYGIHACIGQGLARIEGQSILAAFARRVARFEIGEPVPHLNNLVRGLASLPVTVVPA
jgi:cytochrome P450